MAIQSRLKVIALGAVSISLFLLFWQLTTNLANTVFLPGPYQVLQALIRMVTVGDRQGINLFEHAAVSLYRVLLGFALGAITAVPLGILLGVKPIVKSGLTPILEPLRFIPPIAWIPLAIVLLSGVQRYVFLIWIGVFFPVLLNTIAGVMRTSITQVNMAKTFGADNSSVIRRIVFPSSLPEIMSGLRVGLGIGWMCIVAAEFQGGDPYGLGRLILDYANLLQIDVVIVGMLTIGIIGLLLNYFILIIEKRLFSWRVEIRA